MSVIQRPSWIWAVLPETAARIDSHGDPALAEVLRDSGYAVSDERREGAVDVVLYDTVEVPEPTDVADAVTDLTDGGVVAIAVAGGSVTPPRAVPTALRMLQLLASPIETLRALAGARRAAHALREAGFESTRLATGDRSRSRYGLGPGGWVRRLRTPVGFVLTGSRGPMPASLLDTAIAHSEESIGMPLRRLSTTVFESAKVVVCLRGPAGEEFFMRLAAGPAREPLDDSLVAIHAVASADPPAVVRDRLIVPRTEGCVGPLRYALEPNAVGSHPWRMTADLWDECFEFLTTLYRLELKGTEVPVEQHLSLALRMHEYLDATETEQLDSIVAELERRLGRVPRGQSHGDFWSENLLVRDGRLATVLDWEWAAREALPLLDLFDLIALSRRRVRDLPPGERFTEVLWPLARAGGNERVQAYCRALEVPADLETLEALAVAYWLNRTARQLVPLSVFPGREGWLKRNVHGPIRRLAAEGW
ncbi:MAG TPA: phosphotransferase [Thermoleophilaceae bacterium]|nr:phosphotransferase [Thermoleophilaceae bacterium]